VQFVNCSSIVIVMRKQKTMDEGKDYCDRKINLLKSNFDQLVEVPFLLRFMFRANYCVRFHCLS